jgi:hypothetical protein
MLSSLSFNSVDQQHSPLAYDTMKSTPASGNYFRTKTEKTFLGPAPRSQLGVPTRKVYLGTNAERKAYYKDIIGNANFVRGNQFSNVYPYKKAKRFEEIIDIPSVEPQIKGPVDYLGNDAKIVMRNNDPFYPYPSQHLLENKNYWSYMHEKKYMNDQPIYNYPYSKMEGSSRGMYHGGKGYDPYDVENFCGCKKESCSVVENYCGCLKTREDFNGNCKMIKDGRLGLLLFVVLLIIFIYLYSRNK